MVSTLGWSILYLWLDTTTQSILRIICQKKQMYRKIKVAAQKCAATGSPSCELTNDLFLD